MTFDKIISSLCVYLSVDDLYNTKMKAKTLADALFVENFTFSLAQETFDNIDKTMCDLMLSNHKNSIYLLQAFVVYFYEFIGHNIHSNKTNWLEFRDEVLFQDTNERILTNSTREHIFLGLIKKDLFENTHSYSGAFIKHAFYFQEKMQSLKLVDNTKMNDFELFKLHTYRHVLGETYLSDKNMLAMLKISPKKTQEQIGVWREKKLMESVLNQESESNPPTNDDSTLRTLKNKI